MTMYFFDVYTTNKDRKTQSIQLAWGSDLSGLSISAFFLCLKYFFCSTEVIAATALSLRGMELVTSKETKEINSYFIVQNQGAELEIAINFATGTYDIPTNVGPSVH